MNAKRQLGLVPQEFNFNRLKPCSKLWLIRQGTTVWSAKKRTSAAKSILTARLWGKRNERARMLSGGMSAVL